MNCQKCGSELKEVMKGGFACPNCNNTEKRKFGKNKKQVLWMIGIVLIIIVITATITIISNDSIKFISKDNKEKIEEVSKVELPKGIIQEDDVLVFDLKEEDFLTELKNQYEEYFENDDCDVLFNKNTDGWNTIELKQYKEYIGSNFYTLSLLGKLFRVISTHNGYIKEIEFCYVESDGGQISNYTYILTKVFFELTGYFNNDEDMQYIESTSNVLTNAIKIDNHWKNSQFNMAIQYANPGDALYGLPTNTSYNIKGTSTNLMVKTDNDKKQYNNLTE